MKRTLTAAAMVLACIFQAHAQKTIEQVHDLSAFTSVSANKNIEVSVVESKTFSVKVVVDEIICDYTKVYVKGSTLFLDIDEKSYPKELKTILKGKNAVVPRVKATVYMPSLKEVALAEEAVLEIQKTLNSDSFKLSAQDNASVKMLSFNGDQITISTKGKAQVRVDAQANKVDINAAGSSNCSVTATAGTLGLTSSNSSSVKVDGKFHNAEIKSENTSETTVTGECGSLKLETSGLSSVYSDGFAVTNAEVKMSNGNAWINAKDLVAVDIENGAYLVFNGSPRLDIVKVKNSSLLHPADDKKKK
ncbi:MAG: DUF2807 domain-containing protein [Bacteroidales bacterium]|nr:DUF2807 domain-containing protein [Bacteroidales bacterium]